MSFVNPGALGEGFNGQEYAFVDTDANEVIFIRMPKRPIPTPPFTVGILSDTGNITEHDPSYWRDLVEYFNRRDVKTVIHCGNIMVSDIGRPELSHLQVYCALMPDQQWPPQTPANWHLISQEEPVVEVGSARFFVDHDLGNKLFDMNEAQMNGYARGLYQKHSRVDFVLCGLIADALFAEGTEVSIINPGDAKTRRNVVAVCLPRAEITFGRCS